VEIDCRAGKYLIFRAIQKQFLYVYKLSLDLSVFNLYE